MSELQKLFVELHSGHVGNFDPARFAYITGLCQRACQVRYQANRVLHDKALKSVKRYQADLQAGQKQASKTLAVLSKKFPSHVEIAQILYERCEYRQIERLNKQLISRAARQQHLAQLSALNQQADQRVESANNVVAALTPLDDVLRQQEQAARIGAGYTPPVRDDGSGEQLELTSMKYLRESMKYDGIDRVIDRALNDCPENPGPHNPQMLAIRALSQMHALSPQYLRRFASYVETILWLDKNHSKLSNPAPEAT